MSRPARAMTMRRTRHAWAGIGSAALLAVGLLTGCSSDSGGPPASCAQTPNGTMLPAAPPATTPGDLSTAPEQASGYRTGMTPVRTRTYAAVTANPLATQAACRILSTGGTAADALVAAQLVLGLVEPQSSGIGG